MNRFKTTFQAIHYLLSLEHKNKLSIIKLLYLADKYHLLHNGRTITRGTYFAMRRGPVSSQAKDILDSIEGTASNIYNRCDIDVSAIGIDIDKNEYYPTKRIEYDELSESDEEALTFVFKTFGGMSTSKLIDYVHRYKEWKQYSNIFKQPANFNACKEIEESEMFTIVDGKLGITSKDIEELKEILYEV